ncbi:chemotaxis protein CheW [Polaromonas sp. YR568]|uniref:chemotaxis protein CheW n=1 Tax=Polaromonas sp. YR568 TaxID=1855301 RepID=UPI00398BF714
MQSTTDHFQPPAQALEYLAFRLGREAYGMDTRKVQQLRAYGAVARIANAPEYVKGVLNLRGAVVPIVDLRIRFKLGAPRYDRFTVVIMLNTASRIKGMVVDSVSDVITLSPEQIRPPPVLGVVLDTDCLTGLGTLDERMLILVDIDKLMSGESMDLVEGRQFEAQGNERFCALKSIEEMT